MSDKPTIVDNCVRERGFARLGAGPLRYKDFLRSESGVVTIEWVALAAGMVIGCIVVSFVIMNGIYLAASNIASQLSP